MFCSPYLQFSKREDWLRDKNSKEQEVTINSSGSENMLFIEKDREKQKELFQKTKSLKEKKQGERRRGK